MCCNCFPVLVKWTTGLLRYISNSQPYDCIRSLFWSSKTILHFLMETWHWWPHCWSISPTYKLIIINYLKELSLFKLILINLLACTVLQDRGKPFQWLHNMGKGNWNHTPLEFYLHICVTELIKALWIWNHQWCPFTGKQTHQQNNVREYVRHWSKLFIECEESKKQLALHDLI